MQPARLLAISFCLAAPVISLDPMSVAIGAGIAISGYFLKDRIPNLGFFEGCEDKWVPANVEELRMNLRWKVFGQELATNSVVDALHEHYNLNRRANRRFKPLVLSFHGMPGTGKNLVTDYIMSSMFQKGAASRYAHFYSPNTDFWDPRHVEIYKKILEDYILKSIRECQRSIFIFDEVEKLPDGLLSVLEPFASGRMDINGINYSKVVFIFISNTAQLAILDRTESLIAEGRSRQEFTLDDFEDVIKTSVTNMQGGLYRTNLVENDIVDLYVPFLPLERSHVEQCIRVEIKRVNQIVSDQLISNVLDRLIFSNGYSVSGCKRLIPAILSQVYIQRMKVENHFYSN